MDILKRLAHVTVVSFSFVRCHNMCGFEFIQGRLLCVYARMRGGSYLEFKKAIIRKSLLLRPLFWLRVSVPL